MSYSSNVIQESIYWDTVNWAKAIVFWENYLKHVPNNARVLELGCGKNGGLSLWLASLGYDVICSGYRLISETTKIIHKKYKYENKIEYKIIDALNIPYKEHFDIICFKSILGGIVRDNDLKIIEKVVSEIHNALKPGGQLLFAENLTSTKFHKFFRTRFGALKNKWHYFTIEEMNELFSNFSLFNYKTFGFAGCFGRNERQKKILGQIDSIVFDRIFKQDKYYIVSGVALK